MGTQNEDSNTFGSTQSTPAVQFIEDDDDDVIMVSPKKTKSPDYETSLTPPNPPPNTLINKQPAAVQEKEPQSIEEQMIENDKFINKEKVNKIKENNVKKSEWDMFAEQDIDSNFDVSKYNLYSY